MAGRQLYPNPYNNSNYDDLPAGWEMLHDHNTGWPYFVDHNTKSTSWEDPRIRMRQHISGFPEHNSFFSREIPVFHENSKPPKWTHQSVHRVGSPGGLGSPKRMQSPVRVGSPQRMSPPPSSATPSQQMPQPFQGVREIPVQHVSSSTSQSQHPDLQGYTFYKGNPGANQGGYPDQGYPPASQSQGGFPPASQSQGGYPPASQSQGGYPSSSQGGYPPQQYPQMPQPQMPSQPSQPIPVYHQTEMRHPPPQTEAQVPPHSQAQYGGAHQQVPPQQYPVPPQHYQPPHQYQSPPQPTNQVPPPQQQQYRAKSPPQVRRETKPTEPASLNTSQRTAEEHRNHSEVKETNLNSASKSEEPPSQQGPDQMDSAPTETKKVEENISLKKIQKIVSETEQIKERVNSFSGKKSDKEYKYLEEMLNRSILKLDGIESGDDQAVRQARRAAVKEIQSYLDQLDLKAFIEDEHKTEEAMKTDGSESKQETSKEPMDIGKSDNTTQTQ